MDNEPFLKDHQLKAVSSLGNGKILVGGTGAGKSRTCISWYYILNGGQIDQMMGPTKNMDDNESLKSLYIITTAKKRDDMDWDKEMDPFYICTGDGKDMPCRYKGDGTFKIVVDSWNNIAKYVNVTGSVFIFDEDHLTGKGKWVKSFYKIASKNIWIVATATPGDKWIDFYPVFHANGFFKTKREFEDNHVKYLPYVTYPKIIGYYGEGRLNMYKRKIVVQMDYKHKVNTHDIDIFCSYDHATYENCEKYLYNPYSDDPIESGSGLCYCLRRICNSDLSRLRSVIDIIEERENGENGDGPCRFIIFYSFNYELDILRTIKDYVNSEYVIKEYNGQVHDMLPDSDKWIYLVNYGSGAEAWNCITTNTIIFFSQQYSYKTLVQAKGRIDRMNTPYWELYYYHLRSKSKIDRAILSALHAKKEFNEKDFYGKRFM